MISTQLQQLLDFVAFTQKFREIERAIIFSRDKRFENDSEHSYQLALVSWYIISQRKLKLDIGKVIQYALAHDLVEIYAGDTPMGDKNQEYIDSKHQREVDALERIKEEFIEFPELISMMEKYESREDEESKFVYALDKILPPLNIYLDKGYSWKVKNISLEKVVSHKKEKIAVSAPIKEIGEELLAILAREEKQLFNKFQKIK